MVYSKRYNWVSIGALSESMKCENRSRKVTVQQFDDLDIARILRDKVQGVTQHDIVLEWGDDTSPSEPHFLDGITFVG